MKCDRTCSFFKMDSIIDGMESPTSGYWWSDGDVAFIAVGGDCIGARTHYSPEDSLEDALTVVKMRQTSDRHAQKYTHWRVITHTYFEAEDGRLMVRTNILKETEQDA